MTPISPLTRLYFGFFEAVFATSFICILGLLNTSEHGFAVSLIVYIILVAAYNGWRKHKYLEPSK